jgi:hypothetical protein
MEQKMANVNKNEKAGYHQFNGFADETPHGSFEVFWYEPSEQVQEGSKIPDEPSEPLEAGWYWWACFPGCMPDGEPIGPFTTSTDAFNDANDF